MDHRLLTEIFSVIMVLASLYAQETTTAQLQSHSCFPGCLVILTEDRYFQEVSERGFVGNCFVDNYGLCISRGKVLQQTLKLCKILSHNTYSC